MSEQRFLVIKFKGEEVPEKLVTAVVNRMKELCNVQEKVEVLALDEEDITNIVISATLKRMLTPHRPALEESELTPADKAVIYVGTVLNPYLGSNYKTENFVAKLAEKITEVKNHDDSEAREFMNAIFILSQEDLKISKSILKKYKLDENKIRIIKRLYNLVASDKV